MIHRHQWQEQQRYFVQRAGVSKVNNVTEETVLKLACGYTVVELRCEGCGDVAARELLGDAT